MTVCAAWTEVIGRAFDVDTMSNNNSICIFHTCAWMKCVTVGQCGEETNTIVCYALYNNRQAA